MAALANMASAANQASPASLVAEHLRSPDDLTKIAALRKKLQKEQASLDAKLKSGAKDQLEATRDGLLKLQSTKTDVAAVRESFTEIEKACGDPNNRVKSFRKISQVSHIHRKFVQTANILDKLAVLPDQVDALSDMLIDAKEDVTGPAPNLLPLHYHIHRLEAFRNETLHLARRSATGNDAYSTLTDYFKPLDALGAAFSKYLWDLARNVLDIVRNGHPEVVVKLCKICEVEGREDEKAIAIRLVKKVNAEAAAKFRSVAANARVIKHYRSKLLENIRQSVDDLFNECWMRFGEGKAGATGTGGEGNALAFLEHLQWLYDDLAFVEEAVASLFPPDYKIHTFYVKAYHKALSITLKEKVLGNENTDASALLTLYQFAKDYRKTMTKELGIPQDLLEPSLLEGKEQGIIDDYLKLIVKKIDEWTDNLMDGEVREFVARENQPEEDNEGLYGLQGAVIMFKMVNQQVDLAADSGQGAVLSRVVEEACNAMRRTQQTWLRIIDSEVQKQAEAKSPDDVVGGLVEYVIALANDQVKSADYAEALSNRLEPIVSDKYKEPIAQATNAAMDGYLDVAKRCSTVLIDMVFNDLRPALKDLFAFPAWYGEGSTMHVVVETIRDYMVDYSERLNPNLFEVLLEDMLDRFLIAYLSALRKTSKLRMPAAAEQMREDVKESFGLFSQFKQPKELEENFEVIEQILSLLTASKSMVFLDYYAFAKKHGPQLGFVEGLMRARDDLDKSDVSAIMSSIKAKQVEEPEQPTIMSRIGDKASGWAALAGAAGWGRS